MQLTKLQALLASANVTTFYQTCPIEQYETAVVVYQKPDDVINQTGFVLAHFLLAILVDFTCILVFVQCMDIAEDILEFVLEDDEKSEEPEVDETVFWLFMEDEMKPARLQYGCEVFSAAFGIAPQTRKLKTKTQSILDEDLTDDFYCLFKEAEKALVFLPFPAPLYINLSKTERMDVVDSDNFADDLLRLLEEPKPLVEDSDNFAADLLSLFAQPDKIKGSFGIKPMCWVYSRC